MKREKTVIDVEVSEEKQREIVSSLLREHTNVGMKFERERTRQEEMVSQFNLGPVCTTPNKCESGGFTLTTYQMFSVLTAPAKFKNATFGKHVVIVTPSFQHVFRTYHENWHRPSVDAALLAALCSTVGRASLSCSKENVTAVTNRENYTTATPLNETLYLMNSENKMRGLFLPSD